MVNGPPQAARPAEAPAPLRSAVELVRSDLKVAGQSGISVSWLPMARATPVTTRTSQPGGISGSLAAVAGPSVRGFSFEAPWPVLLAEVADLALGRVHRLSLGGPAGLSVSRAPVTGGARRGRCLVGVPSRPDLEAPDRSARHRHRIHHQYTLIQSDGRCPFSTIPAAAGKWRWCTRPARPRVDTWSRQRDPSEAWWSPSLHHPATPHGRGNACGFAHGPVVQRR